MTTDSELRPVAAERPYRGSGLDAAVDLIAGFPGPTPLAYVGLAATLVAVVHLAAMADGSLAWGRISLPLVSFGVWSVYVLGAKAHIRWLAGRAIDEMRPSLTCDDAEVARLRYRLTTQPALPTLLVAATFVVVSLPSTFFDERYLATTGLFTSTGATLLQAVIMLVALWLTGAAGYAIVHVLRVIDEIYVRHARIDVLAPQDLFIAARLAGRAALAVLVMQYIFVAANPAVLGSRAVITQLVGWQVLAVALFVLPLWNAHQLLVAAKRRLERDIGVRTERTICELHDAIDGGGDGRIATLEATLTALQAAGRSVRRASTWPWDIETPRLLISALVLPMVAWGLQQLLGWAVG